MAFVKVANIKDMKEGVPKVVEANGKALALFIIEGKCFAIDNTCVHQGGPLGDGSLDKDIVTCPWHGWQYNIKTGVSPVNPAAKVQTFNVKVEGEDILVDV